MGSNRNVVNGNNGEAADSDFSDNLKFIQPTDQIKELQTIIRDK